MFFFCRVVGDWRIFGLVGRDGWARKCLMMKKKKRVLKDYAGWEGRVQMVWAVFEVELLNNTLCMTATM